MPLCKQCLQFNQCKGRIPLPNRMNFWKNSKRPLTPPPHFWKIILDFFIMEMVAFLHGGIGQIVSVNINTIVEEKNIPETLKLLFFLSISCSKALFKVPKICNINFWIENHPPPPFGTFPCMVHI